MSPGITLHYAASAARIVHAKRGMAQSVDDDQ